MQYSITDELRVGRIEGLREYMFYVLLQCEPYKYGTRRVDISLYGQAMIRLTMESGAL
jgi:hypothetical protein